MNGRIHLYIYVRNFNFFVKWLLNIPIHRRHWVVIHRRLGGGEKLIMDLLCQLEYQVCIWVLFKCAFVSQNRNCANFYGCSELKSDQ